MTSDSEVADAQAAGLTLAVAALMGALRRKGLLDEAEVDAALQQMGTQISGSRLAQATPDDALVQATLAPITELRKLNGLFDAESGDFKGWLDGDG